MRFLFYATLFTAVFVYADPDLSLAEESDDLPAHLEDTAVQGRLGGGDCDLINIGNYRNFVCAARCVTLGYKGGYCNSKLVCACN